MAAKFASLIGRVLLPRRRRNFLRDERGVTAIEFGLLALPFFAIMGAIMETSIVFLSGQILDSAVYDVSRQIRTGQAQQAAISASQFKTSVCDKLYGLFSDCDSLHVEIQTLDDFKSASVTPPVDWTCEKDCDWTRPERFTLGKGSSFMLVQVYYKWPVILNLGGFSMTNMADGNRLMGAVALFRNEPFS